jgi:RimJ/RimL family protein N-acetyltransferase
VGAAFDVLDLHRVTLYHAVDNEASCRVAVRAGFQLEGRLRQGYRYGDGTYHDEHVHGLLAADVRVF